MVESEEVSDDGLVWTFRLRPALKFHDGAPSEPVEKEVLAWFAAKNLDEEKSAVKRLNKAALDDVVYAPTGFFLSYTAWRKNISGIAKGPLPFFWGVSKSA